MAKKSGRVPGLPERVQHLHKAIGQQKEAAKRLGVPVRTWQEWEAGNRTPGAEWLAALARKGVSVHWLLTGEGEMWHSRHGASRVNEKEVAYGSGGTVDHQLLAAVIEEVERYIERKAAEARAKGMDPPERDPARIGRLVALIYAETAEAGEIRPRPTLVERLVSLFL